tara:strand:+ start:2039 stop:2548 length:510 start_codon:yes stop_codon:yes gene_type:complete
MKIKIILLFLILISCNNTNINSSPFILIDKEITQDYKLNKIINDNEQTKDLKSFEGIYIINFWASWCRPCIDEVKYLNSFTEQNNINYIIGINIFDEINEAKKFMDDNYMIYKNYYDETKTLPIEFGVSGVPETFFMKDNKIIYKYIGKISLDFLNIGLKKTYEYSKNN